jgi:hypothetical protein
MASRNVFYSWQTDSDESFNRYFIEDCVKRAIRKLNREDLSDLVIDRDTKSVPGMPDIGHTILEKIAKSAIVVADVTLINPAAVRRPDERPVSNPNVLFELGYAFGKLGDNAIVGVLNTAFGEIEELPFDLRPKRLMTYRLKARDEKAAVRAKLVDCLAVAIRQCLGDTEEVQIHRISRINQVLSELWLFGEEIEEWYGIDRLPEVIQRNLAAARELPELMAQSGYTNAALNVPSKLISDLQTAATMALNEENWPTIKQRISAAGSYVGSIHHLLGYQIEQGYHDELVRKVAAMPAQLDEHLLGLENSQPPSLDLESLAHELRLAAFKPLIPQHPRFATGLKEISLDLRRHVLRWAKNTRNKDEAIRAVRDIRERLSELIAKYGLTNAPTQESKG